MKNFTSTPSTLLSLLPLVGMISLLNGCQSDKSNDSGNKDQKTSEQASKPDENSRGEVWKGILHLNSKGDQAAEIQFDYENNEGFMMVPDIIPVPLELSNIKQSTDSMHFDVGFRSGTASCHARRKGDSILGVMTFVQRPPVDFWFVISEKDHSIYNQPKPDKDTPFEITTASGDEKEEAAKARLETCLQRYDLEKYLYTKKAKIQEGTIPHSHPILTLNTADTSDVQMLSTFVHEQMHWYILSRNDDAEAAIQAYTEMYPDAPTDLPEGSGDAKGTYMHILVNYLEYKGLIDLVGPEKAKAQMEYLCNHHYTWIYKTLLKDFDEIEAVAQRWKLTI